MTDDPDPIPVGATGAVTAVARHGSGGDVLIQIEVAWDNGRSLMLVSPPDEFEILSAAK